MAALRLALRTLKKTPFTTGIAVLSLALGIGANAAIFSIFDQMLLRPLPVVSPGELVNLSAPGPKPGSTSCNQAGDCNDVFSYPMFRDLEREPGGFASLAGHVLFGANLAALDRTVDGQGLLVTGSYFPTLGLTPALGRLLGPSDDEQIGAHAVTVLGYDYWQNRLGGDRSVLNQSIIVNGRTMTVVGVAPRGFEGTTLGAHPDVYVPMTMRRDLQPGWDRFEHRRAYWMYVFGRLRPGVSVEAAGAQLNPRYRAILAEVEAPLQEQISPATLERFLAREIELTPGVRGQSSLHAEVRTPLLLLLGTTAVVLLIACANVANLLLARGAARAQEMAVRGSLGASRRQLVTQLLTESWLLAALGGVVSLVVARLTLGGIAAILPPEAASTVVLELRPTIVVFAAALALGTGVLFGMYPALHSTRPDLITVLRGSSGQPSGARAAARFRSTLVTAQIALSMTLLFTAGLFIKSLQNVSRVDLGIDVQNVVTFRLSPSRSGYDFERTAAFFERVEERLAAIPGVTAVSSGQVSLLAGNNWGTSVAVEGFEWGPDVDNSSRYNLVGPHYFSTLGMPLRAGREFTQADHANAPAVAVVNEVFLAKFGLDPSRALGARMSTSGGPNAELDIEIVGVIGDNVKYSEVKQEVPPLFFLPIRQEDRQFALTFYARTAGDPSATLRAIPEAVRQLDANLPVEDLKTLRQQVRDNVVLDRLISILTAAFAALATLLAAVGLYGVLAYSVAQRTREFGVRMALGADRGRVRTMILRYVGRLTAIGAGVGLVVALGLGRAARTLLFELAPHDPVVIGVAAVVLTAVALAAGYVPARRASNVDPMQALRYE